MGQDQFDQDGYVDVAERIAEFRQKYPDGSLQPVNPAEPFRIVDMPAWEDDRKRPAGTDSRGRHRPASNKSTGPRTFIVYTAAAYRTPDDPRPGIGTAWEQYPGQTPYTERSELMNAETSAWGRAIVAVLAADTRRGVSSRQEVRNRRAERDDPAAWDNATPARPNGARPVSAPPTNGARPVSAPPAAPPADPVSAIRGEIAALGRSLNLTPDDIAGDFLTWSEGTAIAAASLDLLTEYRTRLTTTPEAVT